MNNNKETLYNTERRPSWLKLSLVSLENLVIFLPLIILPALQLLPTHTLAIILINTVSVSLLGAGIINLIIVLGAGRWRHGVFLPVTSSTPLFAISLMAVRTNNAALIYGMGIASGIFQIILTPLIRWLRFIFNTELAGFITMLLGVWVAQMGIMALFFPQQSTPLLFHRPHHHLNLSANLNQTIIGLLVLIIMLGYRLYGNSIHRMLCILYGTIVGWGITLLFGLSNQYVVSLIEKAPWWHWPHPYALSGYHFDFHFLSIFLVAGFIAMLQIFSMLTMIDYETKKTSAAHSSYKHITRGNIASGAGLVISSCFGAPQSPNPASFGALCTTGVYSKQIAYLYGFVLLILAFSPKVALFFATVPASVRGATIMFLGTGMFMNGLKALNVGKMSTLHLSVFATALLAGTSTIIIPKLYLTKIIWIQGITNPVFVVSIFIYIAMHFLFYKKFKQRPLANG
jgi:xanthine/uracil permease